MALLKVEGVAEARVSYRQARAWVRYDPARTTPERLAEAVNRETVFRASPIPGPANGGAMKKNH
jgi:hypothetical protein